MRERLPDPFTGRAHPVPLRRHRGLGPERRNRAFPYFVNVRSRSAKLGAGVDAELPVDASEVRLDRSD